MIGQAWTGARDSIERNPMTDQSAALSGVYDGAWYANCADGSLEAARIYVDYLLQFIQPRSVLDVGCGRGFWLKAWDERGVRSLTGLDGEWNRQEQMAVPSIRFEPVDLNRPFSIADKADLTMTLEVAEHLQPDCADGFIESLTNTSDLILFGAAYPHQGGRHHTNERPHSYWAKLFGRRDFIPFDVLRPALWDNDRIPFWYRQNTFLYARRGSAALATLHSHGLQPLTHVGFMDCVHPVLYMHKIEDIALLQKHRPVPAAQASPTAASSP
jgi:SAM-dependent methyltransferase